ncbi:MAG: CDP-glycerol glycerophosphotransferase family protein [Clostridia bacterium]|nr:CDP-glycerol glycerophosphotransferase family protein [Clostridia bacterium]
MISVLMPVYNVEKYLEKTLDCLKGQSYADFEVIMVDDGSTDGSGAICDRFTAEDSRFRVIHQPNGGVSAARNRALDEAEGAYIFFMDSDDLLRPETLEELFALLLETHADAAVGNFTYIYRDGTPIDAFNKNNPVTDEVVTGLDYIAKLVKPDSNFYCTLWNKIYKRAVFDGLRFPLGRVNEDEAMIHRIFANCRTVAITAKPYYSYIKHRVSITGANFSLRALDRDEAFCERLEFLRAAQLDDLNADMFAFAFPALQQTFLNCVRGDLYYQAKPRLLVIARRDYAAVNGIALATERQQRYFFLLEFLLACPDRYADYLWAIRDYKDTADRDFSPADIERDLATARLIGYMYANGFADFAAQYAMEELRGRATVSFIKSIENKYYYGSYVKKLKEIFRLEYPIAAKMKKTTDAQKHVLRVSAVIDRAPSLYASYIKTRSRIADKGAKQYAAELAYQGLFKCFSALPTTDTIVFESHPPLTDNTYPVYKYLYEKGINDKYRFVWLCDDKNKYADFAARNVEFLNFSENCGSLAEKLKYINTVSRAKALVYSNKLLGDYGHGRISLCLQHGMPLKKSSGTYCIENRCTAALCDAPFFAENYSVDFRVEKSKMLFFGFPRNDLLFTESDAPARFGFDAFDKIVLWLPTYRQRREKSAQKKLNAFEMQVRGSGIPAIETAEDMRRVNDFLKENNCLLILKPHPAQDMSVVSEIGLSNFFVLTNGELQRKGVQLYALLGKTDALITDYSSVYYDYLLTDKPIGLTVGDIDEYIEKRGFVYDDPLEILKGEYINDTDGLLTFLQNVKSGNDAARDARRAIRDRIYAGRAGDAAEKIGDWLIRQL